MDEKSGYRRNNDSKQFNGRRRGVKIRRYDALLRDSLPEMKLRTVIYDSSNHIEVVTQMYGSILPRVIPYCILNCLLTTVVIYLRHLNKDFTFNHQGHTFLSVMVSFLVVSRSNITYSRFMEARGYLNDMMVACRELNQHTVCFTRFDTSESAQKWRFNIARRTVVLLKTVVNNLQYPSKGRDAWKVPATTEEEIAALLGAVGKTNSRAVFALCAFLRTEIISQGKNLENKIQSNKELKLLKFVSDFSTAFDGIMKLMLTPYPFNLVQMTRTAIFLWVFTLPFALASDIVKLPALIFLVFFITYGFIGLEFVSIELEDPFGDDANDLDVEGLATSVCDDIYINIHDIDGEEAVTKLKKNFSLTRQHKRMTSEQVWNYAPSDSSIRSSGLYDPRVQDSLVATYEKNKALHVVNDLEQNREEYMKNREHPLRR